jgi:hypothetical protein
MSFQGVRGGLNEKSLLSKQAQTRTAMPPHVHPVHTTLKDPSRLFYQSDYNRRLIIVSYWAVIILAIPLWWYTTSIQRLSLPASRVHSHAANRLRFPVRINLENTHDASLPASLQQLMRDRIEGLDVRVGNQAGVCTCCSPR